MSFSWHARKIGQHKRKHEHECESAGARDPCFEQNVINNVTNMSVNMNTNAKGQEIGRAS